MSSLSCKNLSLVLKVAKYKQALFSEAINNGDIKKAQELKSEIEHRLELAFELVNPTNVFLETIRQPEFWDQIIDKKFQGNDADWYFSFKYERSFERMTKLLDKLLPTTLTIKNSEQYEKFMGKLVTDQELKEILEKKNLSFTPLVYHLLNSCYLNKFLGEKQEIIINNIPDRLRDRFAAFFDHGKLIVKQSAGDYLGLYMKGGEITANEAGSGSGNLMSGGTLKISSLNNPSRNSVACKMSGGTFYVKSGAYSSTGDGVTGGTIVAFPGGEITETSGKYAYLAALPNNDLAYPNPRCYFFRSKHQEYINAKHHKPAKIASKTGLVKFRWAKYLAIIEDLSKINSNPTKGMNGGILVLRDVPEKNIGQGMKAGAVIIENPDLTIEEAKSRISKDRKGGIILMRVWENDKPDSPSKLIDLEEEEA